MRLRSRIAPVQSTILLGKTLIDRKINGVWVPQAPTLHYTGVDTRRREYGEICEDELHKGPPYKTGGPFNLWRWRYNDCTPKLLEGNRTLDYWKYTYQGSMVPSFSPLARPSSYDPTTALDYFKTNFGDTDTSVDATKGYTKFSPLKPKVDLGQTIAEIRELPRMLLSSILFYKKIFLRNADSLKYLRYSKAPWYTLGRNTASEWLNLNFGWIPFINTLRDTIMLTSDLDERIARIRHFNDKWETRGGILRDETIGEDVSTLGSTTSSRTWPTSLVSALYNTGSCRVTRIKRRKAWFKAKYKYHIPELNLPNGKVPHWVVQRLYGLSLSPVLVYDLIPFSWLLDWFSNIGDVIASWNQHVELGNMVTSGAYLMDTIEIENQVSVSRMCGDKTHHADWKFLGTMKRRVKSPSPFGFDVPLSGLSSWQTSILSALSFNRITGQFGR